MFKHKQWLGGAVTVITSILIIIFGALIVSSSTSLTTKAAGTARNSDQIEATANKFMAWKKLDACRSNFAAAGAKSNTFNLNTLVDNAVYYETNTTSSTSGSPTSHTIMYYEGTGETGWFGDALTTTTTCSINNMESAAKELDSNINLMDALKANSAQSTSSECTGDYGALNQCRTITGEKIATTLSDILKKYPYGDSNMNGADWFAIWSKTFNEYCTEGDYSTSPQGTASTVYEFPKGSTLKTNDDGKFTLEKVYIKKKGSDGDNKLPWPVASSPSTHFKSCGTIYDNVRGNFAAYVNELNQYIDENPDTEIDVDALPVGSTSTETDNSSDECVQGAEGLAWILCPGQNILTNVLNKIYFMFDDGLQFTILADGQNTSIKDTWQSFLTIANIVFAIAFLVMIYSMATSTGLSNYDIKKMLPRLIVVAIAVNLSFYICAALVDLSNIVGAGAMDLFRNIGGEDNAQLELATTIVGLIIGLLLLGTAIISAVIIFVLIVFRQLALVLLVVVSPVAFALYMLPNTEKWAKKWFDMFTRMLLVYPMFMAIWGLSRGAAGLLTSPEIADEGILFQNTVVSLICSIVPALAILPIFKMSGSIMAMATGAIAGSAVASKAKKYANDKRNAAIKSSYDNSMVGRAIARHGERSKNVKKQVAEGSYTGFNPLRRGQQALNRGLNMLPGGMKHASSSDKDFGKQVASYKYVDSNGDIKGPNDDDIIDMIQGRAVKDGENTIISAHSYTPEQNRSLITDALSSGALADNTSTGGPVTDASMRYAELNASKNTDELFAKYHIRLGGIGLNGHPVDAHEQLQSIANTGSYTTKDGISRSVSAEAQADAQMMINSLNSNAGGDAAKVFNKGAKVSYERQAVDLRLSPLDDNAAQRKAAERAGVLGSAMKERKKKANAFDHGVSTNQ